MGRPKTFIPCYVCFKEFGSKSLTIHEPRCLERWRASNKSLPAEKRAPTPVKPAGWNTSQDSVCPYCLTSVPADKRSDHTSVCATAKKLRSNNSPDPKQPAMTGVVKSDFSPKKGKENKNSSNHIPVPSVVRKNAKNEAKVESREKLEPIDKSGAVKGKESGKQCGTSDSKVPEDVRKDSEESSSTSKRSVRPQTKILRRPTPNLNHPVIQVDSDDSSGDSGYSEKGKDDNPKRLKMGNESSESTHKPKNFIMYNKNNVEKNTKNVPKERTSATAISPSIPNPCNSCSRSQAPERLHSHAKRDSRGLMNYRKSPSFDIKKSPSIDVKMASPHKKVEKVAEVSDKAKTKARNTKTHQNHKENPVAHSASENSIEICVTKDSVLDTKKKCVEVTSEDTEIVPEAASPKKDVLDIIKKCYICEEEFKVSNLLMHESKCLENWKKTNNSLTPNLRKLPPRRPIEDEEDVGDDPAWSAVQSQLLPCPVCGRTFFPERMPVHRRVCKGKPSPRTLKRAASLREQPTSSSEGEDQKPSAVYVPCYVCGRSYGSWVISMHEQRCLRKWRRENEKLPGDDQKDEPKRNTELSADDDVASLVELGDSAWESHLQQLVPCPLCQRTFFPDRLGVHKRSCKGPTSSIRPKSNRGA